MEESIIVVENVDKDFRLPHQKIGTIKNLFTNIFSLGKSSYEIQHALKNISFEVKRGEFFGIVGRNGSGKSTLLKILAGIYQPSQGKVKVHGRLVPFIELGVGFNGELTGRENVFLNGALMGFSEKETKEKYDEIVNFAGLERFMDQKLKNYSSGMQVRLAFSLAIRAEADILLIDEVLAVGDADFQRKCFQYFKELKSQKKTVVFVTHDMNAVREYCDTTIMIEKNQIVASGNAEKVATNYTRLFIDESPVSTNKSNQSDKRWGDGNAKIIDALVIPEKIKETDEIIEINCKIKSEIKLDDPIVGFVIKNSQGQSVAGTNTKIQSIRIGTLKPKQELKLSWKLKNVFSDGNYSIDIAIISEDGITVLDWWEKIKTFRIFEQNRSPYPIGNIIKTTLYK